MAIWKNYLVKVSILLLAIILAINLTSGLATFTCDTAYSYCDDIGSSAGGGDVCEDDPHCKLQSGDPVTCVPDPSDPACQETCTNTCSPAGSTKCVNGDVHICAYYHDIDECFEWGFSQSCGPDETCSNGQCVADTYCGDGTAQNPPETCDTGLAVGQECTLTSQYDYDTSNGIISCDYCASNCGGWITKEAGYCGDDQWQSDYEDCEGTYGISNGQICDDNCRVQGTCESTCFNPGQNQCSGNIVQTCGDFNNDGCTEWGNTETCTTPDICSGGSCICVEESWSTTCSGKCGTQTNNCGNSISCNPCVSCGDGSCNSGETCSSCSADCGSCCGNGVCDNGETSTSCPADCSVNPYCGDGVCNSGETYATCPSDCDAPTNCELNSAVWNAESVTENEQVQLIVNGNDCDGITISFEVYENDLLGDDLANVQPNDAIFSSGVAVGTWTAEWQDDTSGDPEYYFKASATGDTIKSSKPDLITTQDTSYCQTTPVELCGDYTVLGQSKCELDSCGAIKDSIPESIDCDAEGVNCACTWRWETSECSASYSSGEIGTCYLQETGQEDNCDDGFLSYAWTATWEWNEGNFVSEDPQSTDYVYDSEAQGWRYDPYNPFIDLRKSEQCIDGENTIACPAQIQLSFFDRYNFLMAIVLIVLIYLAINYFNNKKTINKKRTRRKKKK